MLSEYELNLLRSPTVKEFEGLLVPAHHLSAIELLYEHLHSSATQQDTFDESRLDLSDLSANSSSEIAWAEPTSHIDTRIIDCLALETTDLPELLISNASTGNLTLVQSFVEEKYISVNAIDESGTCALYAAISNNHYSVVKYLLYFGANCDDTTGVPQLISSAHRISPEITKLLFQFGCDMDCPDSNGDTALMKACIRSDLEVARVYPKSSYNIRDSSGRSILWKTLLADEVHVDVIAMILSSGIDVNEPFDGTPSPLAFVCGHNKVNLCQILLAYPHCRVTLSDFFYTVRTTTNPAIIDLILSHGSISVNCKDFLGGTALFYALASHNFVIANHLFQIRGIDRNPVDADGFSMTRAFLHIGDLAVVQWLINKGYVIAGKQAVHTVIHGRHPTKALIELVRKAG